ncbi:hypothetical protein SDJN02_13893, partial [Cucurbita argyrosperma subsp. argyrosperma]
MLRSSPQSTWDLTIHPPSGPSILAGTHSLLQSMWDPSLQDPTSSLTFIPSPIDVEPPNPPHFGAQCPCWHTALYPPPFRAQPPRWYIVRCLALIPIKECFVPLFNMLRSPLPPMWDLTIYPLSGLGVLAGTHSPLQSIWNLTSRNNQEFYMLSKAVLISCILEEEE